MGKKSIFTKFLAIIGTMLVWSPILAPVLISIDRLITGSIFQFDYLIPAELFPVALIGGGLLLWGALRVRLWHKLIAWGLVCAIVLLGSSQGLAVVTGLASGGTAPVGLWWALALAAIIAYALALAAVGVGGVLLLSDLFKSSR